MQNFDSIDLQPQSTGDSKRDNQALPAYTRCAHGPEHPDLCDLCQYMAQYNRRHPGNPYPITAFQGPRVEPPRGWIARLYGRTSKKTLTILLFSLFLLFIAMSAFATFITVAYTARKPILQDKWATATVTQTDTETETETKFDTVTKVQILTETLDPVSMTFTVTETFRAPRETVKVVIEETTEVVAPVLVTSYRKVNKRVPTTVVGVEARVTGV
ncbi:hypothetical protein BJ508DRAFT_310185 [Ascobolus immersus RN42]|uniref:Uncharacterized protein n=1 Tax=Ascobolus immersus RN42 TaxID=1160509 RepID=A0A3N4HUL3_ASCIM|nr:hypothetical protein BJ508DRAFT_310185 [Ascobolus immersus RN42]